MNGFPSGVAFYDQVVPALRDSKTRATAFGSRYPNAVPLPCCENPSTIVCAKEGASAAFINIILR